MNVRTLLTLGRTSNLPTVWSNVLAGAVLSGAVFGPPQLGILMLAGSAFYEGGMFLNDAFDAEIDARERPGRPIPAGLVTRGSVLTIGFGLLALGIVTLLFATLAGITKPGWSALLAGLATCAAVLVYNRWHKGHSWSPIVMGACRAGLYATAALSVSKPSGGSRKSGRLLTRPTASKRRRLLHSPVRRIAQRGMDIPLMFRAVAPNRSRHGC